MRRYSLPIAILTAFFVLEAPLCALACLPTVSSETAMPAGEHADMPCHDSAPSAAPDGPARQSDDCDCGDAFEVVMPSTDVSVADRVASSLAAVPSGPTFAFALPRNGHRGTIPLEETDLPPPDILLLKSTLLI
jgi:hypothetical protein